MTNTYILLITVRKTTTFAIAPWSPTEDNCSICSFKLISGDTINKCVCDDGCNIISNDNWQNPTLTEIHSFHYYFIDTKNVRMGVPSFSSSPLMIHT